MAGKRLKQIEQSQEDFLQAFMVLLENYAFREITVSMVADRAGYARRTFYRHFSGIEDLLALFFSHLSKELFTYLSAYSLKNFEELVERFFQFWQPYKHLLATLEEKELLMYLQTSWYGNVDKTRLSKGDLAGNTYAYSFALGGMFSLLLEWIQAECLPSPQDMRTHATAIVKHLGVANNEG